MRPNTRARGGASHETRPPPLVSTPWAPRSIRRVIASTNGIADRSQDRTHPATRSLDPKMLKRPCQGEVRPLNRNSRVAGRRALQAAPHLLVAARRAAAAQRWPLSHRRRRRWRRNAPQAPRLRAGQHCARGRCPGVLPACAPRQPAAALAASAQPRAAHAERGTPAAVAVARGARARVSLCMRACEPRTSRRHVWSQAAENAERRELFPVRKKSFDLGF